MKIIGHHTCSRKGSISVIEKEGPFLSKHVIDNPENHKFLGTGYYFWDNNIGMAHSHGQKHYRRKYFIFEAELDLEESSFLDLAGNRVDMIFFQKLIKKLNDANPETRSWTLAHYIEFLKAQGKFPFRSIRAIDTSIDPKEVLKFVPDRRNYINLNPIFIVCLTDKEDDLIVSFKHIKTFPPDEKG